MNTEHRPAKRALRNAREAIAELRDSAQAAKSERQRFEAHFTLRMWERDLPGLVEAAANEARAEAATLLHLRELERTASGPGCIVRGRTQSAPKCPQCGAFGPRRCGPQGFDHGARIMAAHKAGAEA